MIPEMRAEREGYEETMTAPFPGSVQSPYSAACRCGLDRHWDAGQVRAYQELGERAESRQLEEQENNPPRLDPEV